MGESTVVHAEEREITITRVFDAPRALVFQAWTDPDHLARWFGPAGFEIPRDSVSIEPRVGGRITLRMVQPGSGHQFDLDYEILELVEPELLVLKSGPNPAMSLHREVVTRIQFEDESGKTRLTLTDGPYPEQGGRWAGAGWNGAFDKLAVDLASKD
jgi:uncharacterized protein YndB with AHSA1/START domain